MRKHILRWGVLGALAVLFIIAGSACKSSETDTDVFAEKTFYSTSSQSHTHALTMTKIEIESPPTGGVSRATSLVNSHVHTFSMSQDQLQQVKNGSKLDIETSVDSGHSHTFTIQKWW